MLPLRLTGGWFDRHSRHRRGHRGRSWGQHRGTAGGHRRPGQIGRTHKQKPENISALIVNKYVKVDVLEKRTGWTQFRFKFHKK